jgi:hypothetical protein
MSLKYTTIFLLVIAASFTSSCEDETPIPAPARPIFVNKSSDSSRVLLGIRRALPGDQNVSNPDGIFIQWRRNSERDLGGYEIYRSSESSNGRPVNFQKIGIVAAGGRNDTSYVDGPNLSPTITYAYRLKAYSRSNSLSAFSDSIVSWKPLLNPTIIAPTGSINMPSDSTLSFQWDPPDPRGGDYSLRLYEINLDDSRLTEENCVATAYGKVLSATPFGGNATVVISFKRLNTGSWRLPTQSVFRFLRRGGLYRWVITQVTGLEIPEGSGNLSNFSINP